MTDDPSGDLAWWQELTDLTGWQLGGFHDRKTATFYTPGMWPDRPEALRLTCVQKQSLMGAFERVVREDASRHEYEECGVLAKCTRQKGHRGQHGGFRPLSNA